MQVSIVILTNEFGTSIVQMPNVATIKTKPSDNNIFVLSSSDDDVCSTIDLFGTYFLYEARIATLQLVFVDINKTHYRPFCMKLACHGSPSQCPPLYLFSSSSKLGIVNALKLTKSRKMFKSDFTIIDFDNIDVHDIKCFPPSFRCDVLFILPPLFMDANVYNNCMDDMDKICNAYFGAQQQKQIPKMILDFFMHFSCAYHV